MSYERGDVVEAGDPITDANTSRPFLVVNTDDHPFHGDQYVAVTLTTKTWYDDTIGLEDADFLAGVFPTGIRSCRGASLLRPRTTSPAGSDISTRISLIELSKN